MNIGGGEAADQLVRMMLSGSEVAVRLSGSAIKNVLALTMALAKKHKTISGKVNLSKMLKETRDVRRFSMSPEQYQQFRQRAGKQKILFSAIRDSDNKGKVVDVIMPVTEIDRANRMVFQTIYQKLTQQVEEVQSDRIQIHNERYRLTKKDVRSNLERCLDMVKARFPDKEPLIQEMIRSIR